MPEEDSLEKNLPEENPQVTEDTQVSNESVPQKDPVEELKATNQHYAEEIAELRANIDMLRNNASTRKPEVPDEFGELEEDDLPTVKDVKRVLYAREQQYREALEEVQIATQYSDYKEVISNYLPKLLKAKPHLKGSIEHAPNKALAAYELASMYKNSRKEGNTVKQSANEAARIVKNANKPASISQAGGQSATDAANYYANMSDEDFMKLVSKNIGE